jgi:hypothetical protein
VTEELAVRFCEVAYEEGVARAPVPPKLTIQQMIQVLIHT